MRSATNKTSSGATGLNRHGRGLRRSGQALVEAIVIMVVLLNLVIAIPLIGKMGDVKHRAIQASRYAAWERTVWYSQGAGPQKARNAAEKSDASIKKEVWARFFADQNANGGRLKDTDKTTGATGAYDEFLGEHIVGTGTQRRLMKWGAPPGQSTMAVDNLPGVFQGVFSPVLNVLTSVSTFSAVAWLMGGNVFDIEGKGMYGAEVRVPLAKVPSLLSMTNMRPDRVPILPGTPTCARGREVLCFSGRNVLLADAWNAEDSPHAENRVRAMVLTNITQNDVIKTILEVIQTGLGWIFPSWGTENLKIGHVDMEALPADRSLP